MDILASSNGRKCGLAAYLCGVALASVIGAVQPLPATAQVQTYPSRPIRIVVPFPAGGSNDVAARIIAEHLSSVIGQPVYTENKGGANGTIGTTEVARSAADGYTILITSDSSATNLHNFKSAINPARELTPLIQISKQPVVLAVHPSLGVQSIAELIARAKQEPGLRYGTGSGLGSPQFVVAEWFRHLADIKLEQVPYRGGAQLMNDLVGGHIKAATMGATPAIPYHRARTLFVLAQSGDTRSPILPDVPTFKESGFGELVLTQWYGVFAPAGLPSELADRLNGYLGSVIAMPRVQAALLQAAQEAVGGSRAAFAELVRSDVEKYGRLKKQLEGE